MKRYLLSVITVISFVLQPYIIYAAPYTTANSAATLYNIASQNDGYEQLLTLSHDGQNIDVADRNGDTAVCLAIKSNNTTAYNNLIDAGANPKPECIEAITKGAYAPFSKPSALFSTKVGYTLATVAAIGAGFALASGGSSGGSDPEECSGQTAEDCPSGQYISATCETDETKHTCTDNVNNTTENCAEFVINKDQCTKCQNNYYNRDGNCIARTITDNCEEFAEEEDACLVCQSGYRLSEGRCLENTISHCADYASETTCETCDSGYALSQDAAACVSIINRCISYNNQGSCELCDGEMYVPSRDGTACVYQIAHCISLNADGTCEECASGFVKTSNSMACVAPIDNCANYNTDGTCAECSSGYVKNASGSKCFPAIDNCSSYDYDGTCAQCNDASLTPSSDGSQCIHICAMAGYSSDVPSCASGTHPQYCTIDGVTYQSYYGCVENAITGCSEYNYYGECSECDFSLGYILENGTCRNSGEEICETAGYTNVSCTFSGEAGTLQHIAEKCSVTNEQGAVYANDNYWKCENNSSATWANGCTQSEEYADACQICRDGYNKQEDGTCKITDEQTCLNEGYTEFVTCSSGYHASRCSATIDYLFKCEADNIDGCIEYNIDDSCATCDFSQGYLSDGTGCEQNITQICGSGEYTGGTKFDKNSCDYGGSEGELQHISGHCEAISPDGQTYYNNSYVSCADNTTATKDSGCLYSNIDTDTCLLCNELGYELKNGQCEKIENFGRDGTKCKDGFTWNGVECVRNTSINPTSYPKKVVNNMDRTETSVSYNGDLSEDWTVGFTPSSRPVDDAEKSYADGWHENTGDSENYLKYDAYNADGTVATPSSITFTATNTDKNNIAGMADFGAANSRLFNGANNEDSNKATITITDEMDDNATVYGMYSTNGNVYNSFNGYGEIILKDQSNLNSFYGIYSANGNIYNAAGGTGKIVLNDETSSLQREGGPAVAMQGDRVYNAFADTFAAGSKVNPDNSIETVGSAYSLTDSEGIIIFGSDTYTPKDNSTILKGREIYNAYSGNGQTATGTITAYGDVNIFALPEGDSSAVAYNAYGSGATGTINIYDSELEYALSNYRVHNAENGGVGNINIYSAINGIDGNLEEDSLSIGHLNITANSGSIIGITGNSYNSASTINISLTGGEGDLTGINSITSAMATNYAEITLNGDGDHIGINAAENIENYGNINGSGKYGFTGLKSASSAINYSSAALSLYSSSGNVTGIDVQDTGQNYGAIVLSGAGRIFGIEAMNGSAENYNEININNGDLAVGLLTTSGSILNNGIIDINSSSDAKGMYTYSGLEQTNNTSITLTDADTAYGMQMYSGTEQTNNGYITISNAATAYGMHANNSIITNNNTITINGGAQAYGMYVSGSEGIAINNGDIYINVDANAGAGLDTTNKAVGMYTQSGTIVNNTNASINIRPLKADSEFIGGEATDFTPSYGLWADSGRIENAGKISITYNYLYAPTEDSYDKNKMHYGVYATNGTTVYNSNLGLITLNAINSSGEAYEGEVVGDEKDTHINITTPTEILTIAYKQLCVNGDCTISDTPIHITENDRSTPAEPSTMTLSAMPQLFAMNSLYIDASSTLINGGTIESDIALNTDELGGGKFVLTKNSTIIAPKLSGTFVAGADAVAEGNLDEYVSTAVLQTPDATAAEVVSATPMFVASLKQGENDTHDIVYNRVEFAELVEDKSVAQYLEDNYIQGNAEQTFKTLKSAATQTELQNQINQDLGMSLLPNFAQENFNVFRSLNNLITDNLYSKDMTNERMMVGYDYLGLSRSSRGKVTGYEDNAHSSYFIGDIALDKYSRWGLGLSITRFDADYDDDSDRDEVLIQALSSYMYDFRNNWRYAGVAHAGYGYGDYTRRTENNGIDGNLHEITYGLSNEMRYNYELPYFTLEPQVEMNFNGYYQRHISEENKADSIYVKGNNNFSAESGLGLYASKDFNLADYGRFKGRLGGSYYHEWARPYHTMEAHLRGTDGYYRISADDIFERDRFILSADITYTYKAFDFYLRASEFFEKEDVTVINAGLKYNF